MGNAVSKVFDTGLKVACVATGGLFGKSEDGFHLGPLRLKKDSFGISQHFGICNVNVKFGRNEFGNLALDGSVTCGISGVASSTLRTGVESTGLYCGLSCLLNVGPAKAYAGILADSKGNVRSYSCGATGPLLTNVQFSKEEGVSGGIFGLSVNKNKGLSFTHLEDALINKAGEKVRVKYGSYKQEEKSTTEEKDEESELRKRSKIKFRKNQDEKKDSTDKKDTDKNRYEKTETANSESKQMSNIRLRTTEQRNMGTTDSNESKHTINAYRKNVDRQRDTTLGITTAETLTTRNRPVSNTGTEVADITLGYCAACNGPCKYR